MLTRIQALLMPLFLFYSSNYFAIVLIVIGTVSAIIAPTTTIAITHAAIVVILGIILTFKES